MPERKEFRSEVFPFSTTDEEQHKCHGPCVIQDLFINDLFIYLLSYLLNYNQHL